MAIFLRRGPIQTPVADHRIGPSVTIAAHSTGALANGEVVRLDEYLDHIKGRLVLRKDERLVLPQASLQATGIAPVKLEDARQAGRRGLPKV